MLKYVVLTVHILNTVGVELCINEIKVFKFSCLFISHVKQMNIVYIFMKFAVETWVLKFAAFSF